MRVGCRPDWLRPCLPFILIIASPDLTAVETSGSTADSSSNSGKAVETSDIHDDGIGHVQDDNDTVTTQEDRNQEWFLRNRLRFGYDTNVLVEPEDVVTPKDGSSISVQDHLSLRWSGSWMEEQRLSLRIDGEFQWYTGVEDVDLGRLGAAGSWKRRGDDWIPHATLSFQHYRLAGEAALDDLALSIGCGWLRGTSGVGIACLQLRQLDYPTVADASGERAQLKLGWWFLGDAPGRRLEADCAITAHNAEADAETYRSLQPRLRGRWRWSEGLAGRPVDLSLAMAWERRRYQAARGTGVEEELDVWSVQLAGQWQWSTRCHLGASISFTTHASNDPVRDFDRGRFFVETTVYF